MMDKLTMYIGGTVFGFGLALSGATKPEVVLSFLQLKDLGLVFVIGGALLVVLITYQGFSRIMRKPPFGEKFDVHDGFPVTSRTVVGAVIFGLGWGIAGICPATSIAALGTGNWPLVFAVGGILLGALVYGSVRSKQEPTHK